MVKELKTVLAIGGSDPTCGAGIQVDVRVIASLGLHPLSVITALTAQNSKSVTLIDPVSINTFLAQIDSIFVDVIPDAIKIGMIGSLDIAGEIGKLLQRLPSPISVVVDPVYSSTVGGALYNSKSISSYAIDGMLETYINEIFPFSTLVTPNIQEARAFINFAGLKNEYEELASEEAADLFLRKFGCKAVIIKGGDSSSNEITDYLAYKELNSVNSLNYVHKKIDCRNLHGTGCVFSSLIASLLAQNLSYEDAFIEACKKMEFFITRSAEYKMGQSTYGPLDISGYMF